MTQPTPTLLRLLRTGEWIAHTIAGDHPLAEQFRAAAHRLREEMERARLDAYSPILSPLILSALTRINGGPPPTPPETPPA